MLAPPVIVIHGTELVAVHAHDPPVVTATLPFMPVEIAEMLVGAALNAQLFVLWVTVTS
jgi:hypothetical protein